MAGNGHEKEVADEDEFAEYAARALPRLRRIAFLLCQDWHRADDLTQTTLTRVFVHWRRASTAENRDAYIGAILLNAYLSEQRTSWWKRTSVYAEPVEPPAPAADDGEAPIEDALDLRAALHTLSPRRRATIVLRYYCDYSIEQTALLLDCSPGTVKSQTAKAIAQLRDALSPQLPSSTTSIASTDNDHTPNAAGRTQ